MVRAPGKHRTVVLGASHAGGRAAQALRQLAPDRDIVLIGRERHPPYERPPVSKALLAGAADPATACLHPIGWYLERAIKLCPAASLKVSTGPHSACISPAGSTSPTTLSS
jgi:NADPH-dependent 2,4-dienoyl-CoA reductase/sulfur reductase-like enzyme